MDFTSNRSNCGGTASTAAVALAARHARRRSRAGFTLAEVLAALLFMSIVIPVAVEALHIASLAGAVATRKGEAARVAQRILDESLITTNWTQTYQTGTAMEGQRQFNWSLRSDPWNEDPTQNVIRQLTVEVEFTAQNNRYSVRMSTLVDSSQQ
jgi:type II secretory pathway pseudopilin PulG